MKEKVLYSDNENTITEEKLNSLTPRERKVVEMRLGILNNKEHTYKEIGLHFDRGAARARQIALKAFRKMRHPRFIKPEEIPLFERPISSIVEDRRVCNCLASEDINCLNDLKNKRFENVGHIEVFLLKIPNMAKKSILKFKDFLNKHNISFSDFVLNKEEVQQDKMTSLKKEIDDIKSVINSHYHHLKRLEGYLNGTENKINQRCEIEVEAFKNEMHALSSDIQRHINSKILAFNEYMAVERYRLDQLLSNIKLTG